MNTASILSAIDEEIARLEQARLLLQQVSTAPLTSAVVSKRRGRPPGKMHPVSASQTRILSEEGRARITAAQKARWAAKKKAGKTVSPVVVNKKNVVPVKKQGSKKVKSAEKKGALPKSSPLNKKMLVEPRTEQTEQPALTDQTVESTSQDNTSAE